MPAAGSQIEDEQQRAYRGDQGADGHARCAPELIAADADDALEERDAQQEQDHADAHQPCPRARVARPIGHETVQDHPYPDRTGKNECPRVRPALEMVGGVLIEQDESSDGDDAAEDGETLAEGAPGRQGEEEDHDARGDDEERPAVVSDVDPDELSDQPDRPDEDEQPTQHHRRAARPARRLAIGHGPTLPRGGRVSRAAAGLWPVRSMTDRSRSTRTPGNAGPGRRRPGARAGSAAG